MDKLERIGHLIVEARSKARFLARFALKPQLRAKAADLMKRVNESHQKLQTLSRASQGNGKGLDQKKLDSALDDLIKTFEDVNRKLDELIAEAKQ
jgi:fructose-1,6-bisphosphatase